MSLLRLSRMDDEQLGRALHALEPMLLTQGGPDVTGGVAEQIRSGRRPRHRISSRVRLAILIAAALLLLATAAAAARLVIDVGGIRIEPPVTSSLAPSGPPLNGPALGEPTSLAQAQAVAGFHALIPRTLGRPDRVWLSSGDEPGSVLLAMAWFPRPGLARIPGTPFGASLIEVRGTADLVAKHVETRFLQLAASGAYWIHTEHEVELLTGDRTRVFVVTGNVLIWQEGSLALRLETNLPRGDALAVADLPS